MVTGVSFRRASVRSGRRLVKPKAISQFAGRVEYSVCRSVPRHARALLRFKVRVMMPKKGEQDAASPYARARDIVLKRPDLRRTDLKPMGRRGRGSAPPAPAATPPQF